MDQKIEARETCCAKKRTSRNGGAQDGEQKSVGRCEIHQLTLVLGDSDKKRTIISRERLTIEPGNSRPSE